MIEKGIGLFLVTIALMPMDPMLNEEQRQADLRAGGAICATYGVAAGSPDHTGCTSRAAIKNDL